MKLHYEIFRYRIPLRRPLTSGPERPTREGALLRVADSDGVEGWGEASPLPGFSPDDLASTLRDLKTLAPDMLARCAAGEPEGWKTTRGGAAARFALESAWFRYTARRDGVSFAVRLGGEDIARIPVAALLSGTAPEVIEAAARAVEKGASCLKLKVGRGGLAEEIEMVQQVQSVLSGRTRLRLDANRAWSLEEAVCFCTALDLGGIEFVEEPLHERRAWNELASRTEIPLALDESLPQWSTLPEGVAVIVLKPTLLGGVETCLNWAGQAQQAGAVPVISALFESSVGLRTLAGLAAVLQPSGLAVGLDTHRWLQDDLLDGDWPVRKGSLDLTALNALPEAPTPQRLERITHG